MNAPRERITFDAVSKEYDVNGGPLKVVEGGHYPARRPVKLILDECISIGLGSLFLVALVSTFMGAVTTVQTAFNMVSELIPNYVISQVVREMIVLELAPTIIAVIYAGKVGSSMAGGLGTMRITEQIDALEVRQVGRDVERQAVEGHPPPAGDAHRAQFLAGPRLVRTPHTGLAGLAIGNGTSWCTSDSGGHGFIAFGQETTAISFPWEVVSSPPAWMARR